MDRESFSSPETASLLNRSFLPIKVDRESRPDIDEIYMNYVTATTGSGGWPLNVFLCPNLEPVFGGTYWPARGKASPRAAALAEESPTSFLDVLEKMAEVWSTQKQRCILSARETTRQLRDFAAEGSHSQSSVRAIYGNGAGPEPIDLDLLDDALDHFVARYDATHGGFTSPALSAPKFPTPPNLAFLLRIGASIETTSTRFGFPPPVPPILGKAACENAASMALHTLLSMSRSGLRDHLGHGFHRYSVTTTWNLPHFEKMLCDNAQLLSNYCDAFALSRNPEILGTIYSLVEYFTSADSSIVNLAGGFYASEDADARPEGTPTDGEKREGAFYVWTLKEFQAVLGPKDVRVLARHFGVNSDGNVSYEHDAHDESLGQNVLHIAATPSVLARDFGMSEKEIITIIKAGKGKLQDHRRRQRPSPDVDTHIIAGWNALAISALARAANTLVDIDQARSSRCRDAAQRTAEFIKKHSYDPSTGRLRRIAAPLAANKTIAEEDCAFVDDYAYLTQACLSLYDLTFEEAYLEWAHELQAYLTKHFLAPSGGFYQTPITSYSTSIQPILRLKPGTDNSLPSPNGLIAQNLLYLSSYLQDQSLVSIAKETMDAFAIECIQHPFLFVTLLGAVVMEAVGLKSILVVGDVGYKEARNLDGWGRTVVRVPGDGGWLRGMNPVMRELFSEHKDGKWKKGVFICEAGRCREMRHGELEDKGFLAREIDNGL